MVLAWRYFFRFNISIKIYYAIFLIEKVTSFYAVTGYVTTVYVATGSICLENSLMLLFRTGSPISVADVQSVIMTST